MAGGTRAMMEYRHENSQIRGGLPGDDPAPERGEGLRPLRGLIWLYSIT